MNITTNSDDMASFDVLHTQNDLSGSFPSAEYSFLPEVSVGLVPNGVNHVNENFDFTNMPSTLTPAVQDSSVEVHSHLVELIEENTSLKETLNKNNSMMKDQMSTISAWRDQMILAKNQQQQQLQKAKEKISSLEKENDNLLKKLEELLEKMSQNKDVKDFCTKCKILETALTNLLGEKDLEKNADKFASELNKFHAHLQQNLISVCQHLDNMLKTKKIDEKEKMLLRTFILLLKFKIASLDGDFCATVLTDEETGYEVVHQKAHKDESVEYSQSSDICRKCEDLKESVKKKDEELNLLKKQNEELLEKMKAYDLKLKESEMALKSQFEFMTNKLELESSISEKYKERCECLHQQLDELQVKLDRSKMSDDHGAHELREEIKNLQEILKLEQRASQKDKEQLNEVMIKCEKLQVDYDRVTKLFEVQSKDAREKSEELRTIRKKDEKERLEKIDHLTAQLFEVQEQLNESNAKNRELKEQLSYVKEDTEAIPILKAQIQVYKKDFEDTVAARDSACEEVDRLTNELKKCEKKPHPCACKSCPSSRQSGSFSYEPNAEYECPICKKLFTSERAAQNHINRCIEENAVS